MKTAYFLASMAILVGAAMACSSSDDDNNGLCIQPTKPPSSSGCTSKQEVYQCNGVATPAGQCSPGSVKGVFCCDQPVPDAGVGNAVQSGTIVKLNTDPPEPVAGATVDVGNNTTVVTDAQGKYSVNVPLNTPFIMKVTKAPDFVPLMEQEWELTGNADRGPTSLPDTGTQQLLQQILTGYDSSKGVLGVGLVITKSCAGDEGGATITIDPPGSSQTAYFGTNGLPGSSTTSVAGAKTPTAVLYNVTPGKGVKVKVNHPKCTVADFPQADPDVPTITYTGNVDVEATGGTSFVRIFMK